MLLRKIADLAKEDRQLQGLIERSAERRREIAPEKAKLMAELQSVCAHPASFEFRLTIAHRGRCQDTRMRICFDCRLIESEGSLAPSGFAKLIVVTRRRESPMSVDAYRALQERLFEEGVLHG